MPRKLAPEKRLELDSLYRVVAVLAAFHDSLSPGLPDGGFSGAMKRAYDQSDLRGIRMAYNDLVASLEAASASQKRELDAELRLKAGTSIPALFARRFERVARLRQRGKLTSEEQYYLVREYVEFAELDPAMSEDVKLLWDMLHAFEERSAARAKKPSP
jgi:hypothetical protein